VQNPSAGKVKEGIEKVNMADVLYTRMNTEFFNLLKPP
jgi:hypothetical protein